MNLVAWLAIAAVILGLLGLLAAAWITWRHHLPLLFLNQKEVELEAQLLRDRHGERAMTFVQAQELDAWKRSDYAAQARWHRLEQAVGRLQRKGAAGPRSKRNGQNRQR